MIVSTAPVSVRSPYVKMLGRPAEPEASSAPPVDTVAAPSISTTGGAPRGHLGIMKTVGTVGLLAASIVTGVLGAGTANAQAAVEASSPELASCPMPQNAARAGVQHLVPSYRHVDSPLTPRAEARMRELSIAPEHENSTAQATRERYAELASTIRSEAMNFARTRAALEAEGKLLEAYVSRGEGTYVVNDDCTVLVSKNIDTSVEKNGRRLKNLVQMLDVDARSDKNFVQVLDARSDIVATMSEEPSIGYRSVSMKENGHWKSLEEVTDLRTIIRDAGIERSLERTDNDNDVKFSGLLRQRAGDFQVTVPHDGDEHVRTTIVAQGASIFSATYHDVSHYGGDFEESFVDPGEHFGYDGEFRLGAEFDHTNSSNDSSRKVLMYKDGSTRVREDEENKPHSSGWIYEPPATTNASQERLATPAIKASWWDDLGDWWDDLWKGYHQDSAGHYCSRSHRGCVDGYGERVPL